MGKGCNGKRSVARWFHLHFMEYVTIGILYMYIEKVVCGNGGDHYINFCIMDHRVWNTVYVYLKGCIWRRRRP